MKKLQLKLIHFIILCFLILAVIIIHSCKRDLKGNLPEASGVTQAKAWYENTYPVKTSSGTLTTQSITGSPDLSQMVKPDWQHATSYTRLGQNVIEMPVDPGAKLNITLKTNNWMYNKDYSRSYYLLVSDSGKYYAYIMTVIADSSYVKNDLSKLAHNTYRKHDADFSGVVFYSSPKGNYLGGYGYKNGQLITPSATTEQTTGGGKEIQSVNDGKLKPNNIIEQCTDYYDQITVSYADGSYTVSDWEYSGTTCVYTNGSTGGTGSSGGSGSSGGNTGSGGGGGSTTTPPPPCPASSGTVGNPCATINVSSVNNNGLKTNNLVPPPIDGGYPPPPTTTACSVQSKPCTVVDPCDQKADINNRAANSVIANQNSQILSKTTATGNEYGVNQNLTTLNGNTYINSAVTTQGSASQWKPTFSWDSTSGYTVGFSHGHPNGTGPSPEDVYELFAQINLNSVLRNNTPNKQTYEAMASVTTMTATGTYVITINNWNEMNTILTNSYSTDALQKAFDLNYIALAQHYLSSNNGSNQDDAGTYALMQLFPGVINVYYAPVGSNSYTPLIVKTVSGIDKLAQNPCP